jgi:hypothetical protein
MVARCAFEYLEMEAGPTLSSTVAVRKARPLAQILNDFDATV